VVSWRMEHDGSGGRTIATTIRVPFAIWYALRKLSEDRAVNAGGRPSVSQTVVALVQAEEQRRAAAEGQRG
jgi:hypothetical protein